MLTWLRQLTGITCFWLIQTRDRKRDAWAESARGLPRPSSATLRSKSTCRCSK